MQRVQQSVLFSRASLSSSKTSAPSKTTISLTLFSRFLKKLTTKIILKILKTLENFISASNFLLLKNHPKIKNLRKSSIFKV